MLGRGGSRSSKVVQMSLSSSEMFQGQMRCLISPVCSGSTLRPPTSWMCLEDLQWKVPRRHPNWSLNHLNWLLSMQRTLASAGKELKDNFLKALAEREEANRSGKMTSVIFIRDHNTLGQEVSGYIDYAHRLKTQDFEPYFNGKKRLMPGRSDLCYYNWKTQVSTSNSSPNFEVIYDDPNGLLFKNKRDKKILNVDPLSGPGEDSNRTLLQSDLYIHVVIYDHNIRTV
ncbi:cilia- and flagella-associated protein 299 isoform X2 [Trachinotus anak]|uniref:cilia- and flagella-associated protein 299 isoform X2 n=1 Tax=Trachinotus anak TaxID=443729 RepID=UPI0039F17E08